MATPTADASIGWCRYSAAGRPPLALGSAAVAAVRALQRPPVLRLSVDDRLSSAFVLTAQSITG